MMIDRVERVLKAMETERIGLDVVITNTMIEGNSREDKEGTGEI